MRNNNLNAAPFKRIVMGGLVAGVGSAILANVTAGIIEAVSGLHFPELTPLTISLASLIPNLLGAVVYYTLARRWRHPGRIFAVVALLLAVLDTANVTVNAPHVGFGVIADPLHFLVALVSIVVLPGFADSRLIHEGKNTAA